MEPKKHAQSWWKKSAKHNNNKKKETSTSKPLQAPNNGPSSSSSSPIYNKELDLFTSDPTILSHRQIRTLQDESIRLIKLNQQLEMELNLRASQVEQMEDNLRLVADQSKMIGIRAIEQEQKLLEMKKALKLKSKQLILFRGNLSADKIPLNEITVLPMHLRGKFSEFLRGVLMSQKQFFEKSLNNFIMTGITEQELNFKRNNNEKMTRENLLNEIGKIGNSLAYDYMSELELRLNGAFHLDEKVKYEYTLSVNTNKQQQHQQMNSNSYSVSSSFTPNTAINMTHSNGSNGSTTKPKKKKKIKVKTGGAFNKAVSLLSSKKKKKHKLNQNQPQTQALQQPNHQQPNHQQPQHPGLVIQAPQQTPPQQQPHHQQQPSSPRVYHHYPVNMTPQTTNELSRQDSNESEDTVNINDDFSVSVDLDEDDDDDLNNDDAKEEEEDDNFEGDALMMAQHLQSLTKQHTKAIIDTGGGTNELNRMWSQFVQFKKEMGRPSSAPLAFIVPDKRNPFVELRDMLEALPFDLSCIILQEQQMNRNDRIKDVLLQRGCWPSVRYLKNNRTTTINNIRAMVPFDDILRRLEMYLQTESDVAKRILLSPTSKKPKPRVRDPGLMLLGSLDPQKTTGFRLHQITAVVRQRNEAKDSITAINLRVGRLWNTGKHRTGLVADSIDFFQSLESPSTMLLLGANTSEKCSLLREICKILSSSPHNVRTALVDTRSTVGGYTTSPIQTGQAVRFYVNSITNQSNQINATRSIYPAVVVVDEVLSEDDINSISKLQSEGISVIIGTNMHSIEALLGHPTYSQLLPPQHRISNTATTKHNRSRSYSSMSPHLLILEMNKDGTEVKMYKNIPAAVKSIKHFSQPNFKLYKLQWDGYNAQSDTQNASNFMNNPAHKRTTSRMVNKLMKDTLSSINIFNPVENSTQM